MSNMTDEQALAHFGVLGMKWGRHRAKANATDIRAARRRQTSRALKYHDQRDVVKAANAGEKAAARLKLSQYKSNFLQNPDRVVATRMTRGEKAVAAILLPYGLTAIAITSGVSRRLEYKQDKARGN